MIKTKIVCTIGPSVDSVEKIKELIKSGMNVARINMSHGAYEQHEETIKRIKEARDQVDQPLAILLDTKGPEIRVGKIKEGFVDLDEGDLIELYGEEESASTDKLGVPIYPGSVLKQVEVGDEILFNDGYIKVKVEEVLGSHVVAEVENFGVVSSGKGVNIPNVSLDLPAVTEKDIADIKFGCLHDIDIIAASFVRCPEHVLQIREILMGAKKSETLLIAKIENREGIDNFDAILQIADGIMIARGDLGVEIPLAEVPRIQKKMIRRCYIEGKPSITATQMLESMINNPRPTRAEASDVANAIYDGTSAVMLSAETAVGKYPIEAVGVMRDIIAEAEKDIKFRAFFEEHSKIVYNDVASAVTLSAVKTAYSCGAQAIFTFTESGSTARLLSRIRPQMCVVALTPNRKSYHQLSSNWGVIPLHCEICNTVEQAFSSASEFALKKGHVSYGDLVILVAGSPFGISGTTNMIIVENIGDVLVRGSFGRGGKIYGKVFIALSSEGIKRFQVKNKILVISRCDESFLPLIESASAVLLQNNGEDEESEQFILKVVEEMDKPVILKADGAMKMLKEEQLVTVDPEKALVYKGVVV